MDNNYWHKRWQLNEIGFNQKQPNLLLQRYFQTLGLKLGSRVFVPLCGKSIDMLWLIQQGYEVIGVEMSSTACKAFFEENKISPKVSKLGDGLGYSNDKITLFVGDFFQLNTQLLGHVDAVYDRAALIALPMELRQRYAAHLTELLAPHATIFLITTSYNQNEMQGPPFSVNAHEVNALFSERFNIQLLYSKPYTEIPEHLRAKGLLQAVEEVYCLIKKSLNAGV